MTDAQKPLIGFVGQGFIGKNYADDFERRGYSVTRYSLEELYRANKEKIRECDVVFIAVPTPTTPEGFSAATVEEALSLVGEGKVAVIKSTILPGTTERLQDKFTNITLLYSPEFLIARNAAEDAAHPILNIVGFPKQRPESAAAAEQVLSLLPQSGFNKVMTSTEAELFKYTHNVHGFIRVVFANLIHDLAEKLGANYEAVKEAMDADPYMTAQANYYNNPIHQSGRGAGGVCFIKDFAAFRELYTKLNLDDSRGKDVLTSLEQKNLTLLRESGKDLELIRGVYGEQLSDK